MSDTVRYTITVTLDRPIRGDHGDDPRDVVESFTDAEAQRNLEREVLRALKKLDGDADCEVVDVEVIVVEEPQTAAERDGNA